MCALTQFTAVMRSREFQLSQADDEADGTIRFGLDGTEYEIDLSAGHAQALRDALARYVQAARRAGGSARRPARGGRRASRSGVLPALAPPRGQGEHGRT